MKRRVLLVTGALAIILVVSAIVLLMRGSEEPPNLAASPTSTTTTERQAAAPVNTPTPVPVPTTAATPVPDNISAESLRQLVAAAAATVNDVTYFQSDSKVFKGPVTEAESRGGASLTSYKVTGSPESPTLSIGETVDLLIVDHRRYERAGGGPWITDVDDPGVPYYQTSFFPPWYNWVSQPVGGTLSNAMLKPTGVEGATPEVMARWTDTVTAMSVEGPTSGPTGRCWDLIVDERQDSAFTGSSSTHRGTLTVCEPSFLPIKWMDGSALLEDARYNTGVELSVPVEVTQVHCSPYKGNDFEACFYGRR